ncbi:MAG: hypothetical protein K2J82_12215 [Muribaculaceae bacterium]|nr:hypothetical protein [Muribaculaceae bacterium]
MIKTTIKAALVAALLLFGAIPIIGAARSAPKKTPSKTGPDFAFPEKVEKDAMPKWNEAMNKKDGLAALEAGLQLIVARNLISKSNFSKNIEMLDSAAKVMPPRYASLFRLLEANLYTDLYKSNRWTFDNRTLPTDSFPADPLSWSGELFAKKVLNLIMLATDNPAEARSIPITSIKPVITNAEVLEKADATQYDFLVYKSVELLSSFSNVTEETIPFFKGGAGKSSTFMAACGDLADSLMRTFVKYRENAGNIPALVLAVVSYSERMPSEERASYLKEWLNKLIDRSEAARVISAYYNSADRDEFLNSPEANELYQQIKRWLDRFPEVEGSGAVRYCLAQLTEPSLQIILPTQILPSKDIECKGIFKNTDKGYILIYRLPHSSAPEDNFNVSKFPGNAKFIKAIPVETEGKVPFSKAVKLNLPPLSAGYYVAVPSPTPTLPSNWKQMIERWSLQPLNVSEITLFTNYDTNNPDSGRLYVVNAGNQKPVEGASVTILGNNDKVIKTGKTGTDGSFSLPTGYSRSRVSAGESQATTYTGFWSSKDNFKARPYCNIFTDLSIYRPGDSVGFVLVSWIREERANRLLKNEKIKTLLRDANWNVVDTIIVTTDENGRAEGKFRLPDTGLLGNYSIAAFLGKEREKEMNIGMVNFQVAEYKTPTFLVDISKEGTGTYSAGDTIMFKGEVKTYSGMPLGDSRIEYRVSWQPWWRWGTSGGNASFGGSVVADENGKFQITLPTENLKGTKFQYGIFTLIADATSPAGETQSSPVLRFSLGQDYSIRPAFSEKQCVETDFLSLNVPVYDILGLPVIKTIAYKVLKEKEGDLDSADVLKSGNFVSPSLKLPVADIPSGKYRIIFNIEGDSVSENSNIILYRKDDRQPPYKTPLWLPDSKYLSKKDAQSVDVKIGSSYPDSWILAVVSDGQGIIKREWIQLNEENKEISVPAPKKDEKIWLTLSGLRNYEQIVSTIVVEPEDYDRKLQVRSSSFRENISAGAKEKWSFTFSVNDKPVSDIPAFAVMTDKALNALAPFRWSFSPSRGFVTNHTGMSHINGGYARMTGKFASLPKYVSFTPVNPEWNTYRMGLSVNGSRKLMLRGMSAGTVATMKNTSAEIRVDEVQNEVFYAVEEQVAEAPMMMASMKKEAAMDDAAEAESGDVQDAGNGGSQNEIALRPMQMPLAFFMPGLKGDKNGEVSVEFEVPNFNTTWQFQIMGYDEELLTASVTLDAVSSKKVMVQTNAPRFLRTGDKAEISALLFNNSDKEENLHGEIVIFNPLTGETIYSFHQGSTPVAPSDNRKISIEFDVPSNLNLIGIRTTGQSNDFSDGEQTVIPVLPSSTPVVESIQFYIGNGSKTFTTRLPKYGKGGNVTLKYCSNPVWECILALPAISTPDSKNVLTLSQALYANITAAGIVKDHPEIREGLKKLFEKNASPLKSNLEKDSELKMVALNNTPWVNNAGSETIRLNRLNELIDVTKSEQAVTSLMKGIHDLQNSDGGWSWCQGMHSSVYISRRVLERLAMLSDNKSLPREAQGMAKKAIAYCDKKIYSDYVKSGKRFSTTDMLNYLFIRSSFESVDMQSGFTALKDKALKAVAEEWRDFGIYDKALAARLMARSKGYERYAGIILESLRQYAVKSETKGWSFDNLASGINGWTRLSGNAAVLEAFAEVEPKSEAVDGLRQWLVLQKETEDWGRNSNTVEVVQAILSSGNNWLSDGGLPEIYIGGKLLSIDSIDNMTGVITLPLEAKQVSGKELRIVKESSAPVWGGVISQYVSPIAEVKSQRCENLKIEKQLFQINPSSAGDKVGNSELKTGDRVRVTLTLTCDKDMNYVAITDDRPACLEPDDQTSGYTVTDGMGVYREIRDTRTNFFIDFLPKGVNVITYDCHVDRKGEYANGIATIQSQYSPQQVAHSGGENLKIK